MVVRDKAVKELAESLRHRGELCIESGDMHDASMYMERAREVEDLLGHDADLRELNELLGGLLDELESINLPVSNIETYSRTDTGSEVTCGVCEGWFSFSRTIIVDPSDYEYDDFNTEVADDVHKPFDQERVCIWCRDTYMTTGRLSDDPEDYDTPTPEECEDAHFDWLDANANYCPECGHYLDPEEVEGWQA